MRSTICVSGSVEIRRSLPDVFEFVADRRNDPLWRKHIRHIQFITPDPVRRGSQYVERMAVWGIQLTVWAEVIHYEPQLVMVCQSFRATRPMPNMSVCSRRSVRKDEMGQTRVEYEIILDLGGSPLCRALSPVVRHAAQKRLGRNLECLKGHLERTLCKREAGE